MPSDPDLRLRVHEVDPPPGFAERLAALAEQSTPSPTPVRRAATAVAGVLGALTITAGAAWASGAVTLPGLPSPDIIRPSPSAPVTPGGSTDDPGPSSTDGTDDTDDTDDPASSPGGPTPSGPTGAGTAPDATDGTADPGGADDSDDPDGGATDGSRDGGRDGGRPPRASVRPSTPASPPADVPSGRPSDRPGAATGARPSSPPGLDRRPDGVGRDRDGGQDRGRSADPGTDRGASRGGTPEVLDRLLGVARGADATSEDPPASAPGRG